MPFIYVFEGFDFCGAVFSRCRKCRPEGSGRRGAVSPGPLIRCRKAGRLAAVLVLVLEDQAGGRPAEDPGRRGRWHGPEGPGRPKTGDLTRGRRADG